MTEFWGVGQYCPGEKQDSYVGRTIYYDNNSVKLNGNLILENPVYQFGVIPNNMFDIYTKIYPAEGGDIVWGKKNGFFVHVQLRQVTDRKGQFIEFGNQFYIVDENTLILDTDDGWYKAERVAKIEGYPERIRGI